MIYRNFADVIRNASAKLKFEGSIVKPLKWQAREVGIGMWEIFNHSFTCEVNPDLQELRDQIQPNLPWADKHFAERVSRIPHNPPPSYEIWPFYKQDEKWRPDGVFSHSYPERMWPSDIRGIRYEYGNLDNVVNMMVEDPFTRQAFLPIWFPEDTGAVHGERVPCTIGYWFIHRGNQLSMVYPIRSCDFRRHFRNDIYLASRLLLWVLRELQKKDMNYWMNVKPGTLTMQIWNLHVFEGEQNFI